MKQHIIDSIEKALAGQSKLDNWAFAVPGFTSPNIRHLLNNLGSIDDLHYLEIGVHKGGTFVSTNYKNNLKSSIAVDNWSEFTEGDGAVGNEFKNWCSKLLKPNSYKFYEQNSFKMTKDQFPNPVNFYLYDGDHSSIAHKQALTHFYPMLDDTFIFIVDDWNWDQPKQGTREAIEELKLNVLYEQELKEGWWNGLFVSLLKK